MKTLRSKLILTIGLLTTSMLLISSLHSAFKRFSEMEENMVGQTRINLSLVADYLSVPLAFNDNQDAFSLLQKLETIPHLTNAAIYDLNDHLFVSLNQDSLPAIPLSGEFTGDVLYRDNFMYMRVPITYKDTNYGSLLAQIDLKFRKDMVREEALSLLVFLVIMISISVFLAVLFGKIVSDPLRLLSRRMMVISKHNDFDEPIIDTSGKDEIGILIGVYNQMVSQLSLWKKKQQEASEALKQSNEILEQKVEERTHDMNLAHEKVKNLLQNERSILRNLPYGIILINERLEIIKMNEFALELLGYGAKRPYLLTEFCLDIREDEHILSRPAIMHRTDKINTRESEFKTTSGEMIPVLKSIIWIEYDRKDVLMEAFVDISDLKKTQQELIFAKEKAQESDRLKSAFLSTINHELRTPLNHILGFSELIHSGTESEAIKKYSSVIITSGKNLLSIIEDIFELSLIEQSNVVLRKKAFSMMSFFMECKASFESMLKDSGKHEQIQLILNPDPDFLTEFFISDRTKINQILTNLFKNALKFTQKGIIEIGCKKSAPGNLMFYVKDTGIGIDDKIKPFIFDLFRQGDDSDTRLYEGLGIGLTISAKLARLLDGEITVDSESGKGSTFYLSIPVEIAESEDAE